MDVVRKRALSNTAKVAIGVRDPTPKMISSIEKAHDEGYAHVILVGDKQEIDAVGTSLEIINTHEPELVLGDLLASGSVDAAVRGTAKASGTLSHLKDVLKIDRLHRMAFLLTSEGVPFFLAPVGIDEGNNLSDKITLVKLGVEHMRRFGVEPVVGVLSGGRMGDLGRHENIDRTLADADFLASRLRENGICAKHYTILIEDAIKEANFIFAPDGITGNLIFRTLVFLGGGDGIGAPVLMDDHVFVDTSRVGGHYTKAIMIASALVDMKNERNRS
ncbi:methanogenesis marker protein Mmp4/MtxX [Methanococcoides methylutens]|uniref:N5-methyltetrahydromethanopterin:coenzyme M methyltransferase subunit X n=1 Tax=Methanococcoides methylutens MM1 TaxID=1434104 RepID=A0A0E3SQP6_METMT|nr:methanogenesis marker protein Mmp4/MtxX [Methanococcoides methylutens]AKB84448.1 N5-methyltetrahydromethanopterin:coenzyme M methyltransferase subunit X [Methanococcoides methylutens MM1]